MNHGPGRANHRRRGSTLLLVLAMLAVLCLVAMGLAYTARLESAATFNYAQAVQARSAASSGLPFAVRVIRASLRAGGPVSTLQPWYKVPEVLSELLEAGNSVDGTGRGAGATRPGQDRELARRASTTLREAGFDVRPTGAQGELSGLPQAAFRVTDLSGLVNLNTPRSATALNRFLSATLGTASSGKASALAARLAGRPADKSAGTGAASLAGDRYDPRRGDASTSRAAATAITSLRELTRKGPKGQPAVLSNDDELGKLAAAATVFSESPELFHAADGTTIPKISMGDITLTATLAALKSAFPEKDPRLLLQFAANLHDAARPDGAPTRLTDPDHPQPHNDILGVERGVPFITEVYPDSTTPATHADRGQFVEIRNPWPDTMVMAGWRLVVGSSGTPAAASGGTAKAAASGPGPAGVSIPVNAVLPSGGSLVVTDVYRETDSAAPPGTGSFLAVFGAEADTANRKIAESKALLLPDRDGVVTLLDAKGRTMDVFAWGSTAGGDSKASYQRDDPRVRASRVADATPFAEAPAAGAGAGLAKDGKAPLETAGAPTPVRAGAFTATPTYSRERDASEAAADPLKILDARAAGTPRGTAATTAASELLCPVDVLDVPTAFVSLTTATGTGTGSDGRASGRAYAWQSPARTRAQTTDTTNFDLRVMDLFTTAKPAGEPATTATATATPRARPGSGRIAAASPPNRAADRATTVSDIRPARAVGRLNLNTAARNSLLALDGSINGRDPVSESWVAKVEQRRIARLKAGQPPFLNTSELAEFVLPASPGRDDLKSLAKLLEQVTVDSLSFEIHARNMPSPTAGQRRQAVARARWTIAIDGDRTTLLDWTPEP